MPKEPNGIKKIEIIFNNGDKHILPLHQESGLFFSQHKGFDRKWDNTITGSYVPNGKDVLFIVSAPFGLCDEMGKECSDIIDRLIGN